MVMLSKIFNHDQGQNFFKPWSNGQNFDHDHGKNPNFPWSKWSTSKFNTIFNHKNTHFDHDHDRNINFLWSEWYTFD